VIDWNQAVKNIGVSCMILNLVACAAPLPLTVIADRLIEQEPAEKHH